MERKLKIQPQIIPSTMHSPMKVKPKITLQGDWLQTAGFKPNDYVLLTVQDGKIVMEPISGYNN